MSTKRYLAVGHVTLDIDESRPAEPKLGGTVVYAAGTAARLGWQAAVATRSTQRNELASLLPGVDIAGRPTPRDTRFAHSYDAVGNRSQRVLDRAADIGVADLPSAWLDPDVLHVGPVLDEVSAATVADVRASFVGLTVQGWLRHAAQDGTIHVRAQSVPHAILARADGIVLSEEDLAPDMRDWPRRTVRPGRWVAVTGGMNGATLWIDEACLHQPAFPAAAVDPTGAGDVFAAILFLRMASGASAREALRDAAAGAAWSVEHRGPDGLPDERAIREVCGRDNA